MCAGCHITQASSIIRTTFLLTVSRAVFCRVTLYFLDNRHLYPYGWWTTVNRRQSSIAARRVRTYQSDVARDRSILRDPARDALARFIRESPSRVDVESRARARARKSPLPRRRSLSLALTCIDDTADRAGSLRNCVCYACT